MLFCLFQAAKAAAAAAAVADASENLAIDPFQHGNPMVNICPPSPQNNQDPKTANFPQ